MRRAGLNRRLSFGLIFFVPVFSSVNTLKSQAEMFDCSLRAKAVNIENYARLEEHAHSGHWQYGDLVTCGGVALVVVFSAMAAYRIARSESRLTTWLLLFFRRFD